MIAKIMFVKPDKVSIEDIAAFIKDALSSHGGQFHPDDPMFHSLRGKMSIIEVSWKEIRRNRGRSMTPRYWPPSGLYTGDAQAFIAALSWNHYDEHVIAWRWYWFTRGKVILKPRVY